MIVTTPAAMGGFFFLSTAGYIYGLVSPSTIWAAPFIGGTFSLMGWAVFEMKNLFKPRSKHRINFSQTSPNIHDYIFTGDKLRSNIHEDRLRKFCNIGLRRQEVFFNNEKTLFEDVKPITKNTMWSESVFRFQKPRFLPEEVWSCKYILWKTGQFINWGQGSAGFAPHGCSADVLVKRAKRRWKHL